MFVKIKLEPQNSKALSPLKKNITYFPIDDEATVIVLKRKIENYVSVCAERQEIRTLTKSFGNNRKIKELCDVMGGTAVMLYAHNEYFDYQEPQFVCFLQIYDNEMALQQQEMEQSQTDKNNRKLSTPSSSVSSVTLIADSESEYSSNGSATSSSSESNSEDSSSSNESDNSKSTKCDKKRRKHSKDIQNPKRSKPTEPAKLSPTLCKYLDEFPDCSEQIKQTSYDDKNSPITSTMVENSNIHQMPTKEVQKSLLSVNENTTTIEVPNQEPSSKDDFATTNVYNAVLSKPQPNISSTTNEICHTCPALNINPENRQYILIVSKASSSIDNAKCEQLLDWFFDKFRSYDYSAQLQFINPFITAYKGKVWIACLNKNTQEWISSNLSEYPLDSYNIESLTANSYMCEVVIPMVSRNKSLLDIFELLEKQNTNLNTERWCIMSRSILEQDKNDNSDKIVSTFCTNEVLNIRMDMESKKCLENFESKLKYCFWQVVFKFANI